MVNAVGTGYERAALSIFLSEPGIFGEYGHLYKEEYFQEKLIHRLVFSEMLRQYRVGGSFDLITICGALRKKCGPDVRVDVVDITMEEGGTHYNLPQYAKELRELSLVTQVRSLGEKLVSIDSSTRDELPKILEDFSLLLAGDTAVPVKDISTVLADTLENIVCSDRQNNEFLETGFKVLDFGTGGVPRGGLIVLGARPGMGKTAFSTSMAIKCPHRSLFFSLEMENKELALRILSSESGIHFSERKLREKMVESYEATKLTEICSNLIEKKKMSFCDDPQLTIDQIERHIKIEKHKYPDLSYVYVDHLGLISYKGKVDEYEKISHHSRMLKVLAKKYNIVVVALCQLSRNVEQRADKRPMLADLRGSGTIEQDADQVWFLYRPDYYEGHKSDISEVELGIAKNRSGSTGAIEMKFDKRSTRFY